MRGPLVNYAEGKRLAFPAKVLAQRVAIAHFGTMQTLRKNDGVAVQIQHERREATLRNGPQARGCCDHHARRCVCRIEFPKKHLLPDRRPAHFSGERYAKTMALEESQFLCDDERRAVIEGDESKPHAVIGAAAWSFRGCG